ncbi:MAG TPA: hypothetical protein VJI46_02080 [Candidatus Nanoarchaeia archaeon]|nr:hypothetical protein [Candidatus Nanoarchaeia archaeon]
MFSELQKVFKSNIKSLEILALIKGRKPGARILVREDEAGDVGEFLNDRGISTVKSDFKILKKDEGPYSDFGEKIKADDARKGYYVLYLSKGRNEAEKLKSLEAKNDHYNLGIALGYPECCCRFFCDNFSKGNEDLTLNTLKNSIGFSFGFHSNIAMRHFDVSLLFHFPCSFGCEDSIEIAKENLKIMEEEDGEWAKIFRGMLKGAVIYSPVDVILLRRAKLDGRKVHYDGIMALKQNVLYNQLKKEDFILVSNNSSFRIGHAEYSSNIGIMHFS